MTVVGLIVILVGGSSFALRDKAGSSLTSAQNTLAALVGQTRAQAAVNQTEARLLIYAVRAPAVSRALITPSRLLSVMTAMDGLLIASRT